MTTSNTERQARYRAQRPFAGPEGNGERRLNLWVTTEVACALTRLACHQGVSKRAILERLILAEDKQISNSLDDNEWETYSSHSLLRSNNSKSRDG